VTAGWTQRAVADALGISVRTVAKWVGRGAGRPPRSRTGPRARTGSRGAGAPAVEAAILAVRPHARHDVAEDQGRPSASPRRR